MTPGTLIERLRWALRGSTADYLEIRYETEDSLLLSHRGRQAEYSSFSTFGGGVVRACTRGGWGNVRFDTLESLPECVREACECAALVGQDTTLLSPVKTVEGEHRLELDQDFRGVSVGDKLALLAHYADVMLGASPSVETTGLFYRDVLRTTYYVNSDGTALVQDRPRLSLGASATARRGSDVRHSYDGWASSRSFAVVRGREAEVERVARRAADLLAAPKPLGGPTTVILNNELAGVFIHEAFGHLSEADFLYDNPRLMRQLEIGRRLGNAELSVVDDGTHEHTGGTHAYDEEGTPTRKNYLIKDGCVAGHLHSRETAGKLGVEATGNARAIARHFTPIVRMTNTYIEPGKLPVEELFRGVEDGIYACGCAGGQTALEQFTFSAQYGYRIRNGQVCELLRDITLTGNVFDTLSSIDGIASDLQVLDTPGGCGKANQSPLPVGFGGPHVRLRNCVVGGGGPGKGAHVFGGAA